MRTASSALKFLERNVKSPCFSRAFRVASIAYQYWKGSDNRATFDDVSSKSIAYQYWKRSDNGCGRWRIRVKRNIQQSGATSFVRRNAVCFIDCVNRTAEVERV